MKKYYYNRESNAFAVATNFEFKELPQGYEEITEEEFNAIQEQLQETQEESQNDTF